MKTYILILSLLTLSACATNTDVLTETELPGQQLFLDADARVDTLLSKMTLEEKVGQMTQVDQDFLASKSDISDYLMGSLLSGWWDLTLLPTAFRTGAPCTRTISLRP